MGTIFDNKKSIFKKSKPLMTDGCCEVAEPCCTPALRRFRVWYTSGSTDIEITNNSTFSISIPNSTKWNIYIETIPGKGSVNVTTITVPSVPSGLTVYPTPIAVADPGSQTLCDANWASDGVRTFTMSLITDGGNFTFNAQITVPL